MRRLMIVAIAMLTLVYVLPLAAQHGRGAANAGTNMSHKPIDHGKPATTVKPMSGKSTPTALSDDSKLATNLKPLLPANTTFTQACDGFRNLGQCVAALHVSNNLNIDFTDLKTKMLGTAATSTTEAVPGMSLGKAIQTFAPNADAAAEAKKANQQAKGDLKS